MNETLKIQIACRDCGSTKVTRDAWAEWDVKRQTWVLGAVFDYGYCHRCNEEAKLIELPIRPG